MAVRYRKKPVVIEAMQFTGENWKECLRWMGYPVNEAYAFVPNILPIKTLEGTMDAWQGDWIIRGVKGELYPCKPDIFDATYEEIEPWEE